MNEKLSPKEMPWLLWIIGLGILIYGHSLTNGFVWDDRAYLWENPHIASLSGLMKIWLSPGNLNDLWPRDFPLAPAAFWFGHKLWGFDPWGYHALNLTLHILNALVLFGLIRRLKPEFAGITALLFTIHPIQVETVAWISELKNILCLFFFLLAFHSFLDFEKSRKNTDYLKTLLFFMASILSKCTGVCFAVIPLLYAWYNDGRGAKSAFRLTLPLLFLSAIDVFLPIQMQNLGTENLTLPLFPENIILAGKTFFFYITQTLLPLQFLTLYPKWDISVFRLVNWIYPIGVITLYATFYIKRRQIGRGAFALLCFYGISIFPALGFFRITFMYLSYTADHFSYLSVPPILLCFCAILHFGAKKFLDPSSFLKKSLTAAVIVFLSLMSFRLTANYKDSLTLFSQLLLQTPKSPFAFYQLGTVTMGYDPENAIHFFQKALYYKPDFPHPYRGLGLTYMKQGEIQKAAQAFRKEIRLMPHDRIARKYLKIAEAALKRKTSKS